MTETIFGQTPLPDDWKHDLIPSHITLLSELNEYEAQNIEKAVKKYLFGKKSYKLTHPEILNRIHRDMFDEVWKWAGVYRNRNLNIGCGKEMVAHNVRQACDDLAYWVQEQTYSPAEIAIRFHHRIVSVHPYINGNGRHARILADILIRQFKLSPLKWGVKNIARAGPDRKVYINALVRADSGDYKDLLRFAVEG